MQTEMTEKIKELIQNQEYMKHLLSLSSAEEMSKELEKENVEISPEDLRKAYTLIKKKQTGELTDEELEEVAGGSFLSSLIATLVMGAAVGLLFGGGIGIYLCVS